MAEPPPLIRKKTKVSLPALRSRSSAAWAAAKESSLGERVTALVVADVAVAVGGFAESGADAVDAQLRGQALQEDVEHGECRLTKGDDHDALAFFKRLLDGQNRRRGMADQGRTLEVKVAPEGATDVAGLDGVRKDRLGVSMEGLEVVDGGDHGRVSWGVGACSAGVSGGKCWSSQSRMAACIWARPVPAPWKKWSALGDPDQPAAGRATVAMAALGPRRPGRRNRASR